MKKHFVIFLLVFFITLGYATVSTTLNIIGKANIAYNEEDFRIEIINLKINNNDSENLIAKDKQSFTFVGSGNDLLHYTVTNYSYQYDAKVVLVCIPSDNVIIDQINNISAQEKITKTINTTNTKEITCTLNIEKISRTEYAEEMCKFDEGQVWEFNYTGKDQIFKVPCGGEYKVELWGAGSGYYPQGPYTTGSLGGYVAGEINLSKNRSLYVYVGQHNIVDKTFNGSNNLYVPSGGGATDIRLENGNWDNFNSLKSRIIVASGAGASGWNALGGQAGGLNGYTSTGYNVSTGSNYMGKGALQNFGGLGGENNAESNGKFGISGTTSGGVSGGGGYYGGGGGYGVVNIDHGAGGGGSSFISGHNGCDAISESSTETNIIHTGEPFHYSGLKFKNTVMIDGAGYSWTNIKGAYTGMPSHDGKSTMTGNSGHGYAKITYLGK